MKITQASVLGLLGATSAVVTPSNRRPDMSAYPKYSTVTDPAAGDLDDLPITGATMTNQGSAVGGSSGATALGNNPTGNGDGALDKKIQSGVNVILKAAYYNSQPYACYRKGMYYFPPQNIVGGKVTHTSSSTTDTGDALAASADTKVRSFWQVTLDQMGDDKSSETTKINQWVAITFQVETTVNKDASTTQASNPGGQSYGANSANGTVWACCYRVHNQASCNGGIDTMIVKGDSVLPNYRLVIKDGLSKTSTFGMTAILTGAAGTNMTAYTSLYNCTNCVAAANQLSATTNEINSTQFAWTFNNDILLSTMYQSSILTAYEAAGAARSITAGATTYCDLIHHTFATKAAKKITARTSNGFNGSTKCTYQVDLGTGDSAPAMKIIKADFRKFLVHFVEWQAASALSSNYFIADNDASAFKMGFYGATVSDNADTLGDRDMFFLNPFVSNDGTYSSGTAAWPSSNKVLEYNFKDYMTTQADPAMWLPGSVGKVTWIPGKTGQLMKSQFSTFDGELIQEMYAIQKAQNTAYDSLVTAYNPKRDAYNDAVKKETTRLADAAMDPPIEIPERPCPPSQPSAYAGPEISATAITVESLTMGGSGTMRYLEATTVDATADKALLGKKTVYPFSQVTSTSATNGIPDFSSMPALISANKMGWLQAAEDVDVSTAVAYNNPLGHVFGRFGQGSATLPDNAMPFSWSALTAASDKPSMQISLFPEVESTTEGLTADDQTIDIEFCPKEMATQANMVKPTQPSAATAPGAGVSAVYLAATSTAAVALALATLY